MAAFDALRAGLTGSPLKAHLEPIFTILDVEFLGTCCRAHQVTKAAAMRLTPKVSAQACCHSWYVELSVGRNHLCELILLMFAAVVF
jgi:hypothetical protein